MSTFKRFEDIEGWQRAREVTGQIYSITKISEFARFWLAGSDSPGECVGHGEHRRRLCSPER